MEGNNLSSLLSGVMSNPEMMGKLQGILSDPEAMNSIKNAISGTTPASSEKETPKPGASLPLPPSLGQSEEAKNRARLIAALKPYLNAERREKADKLLSLLSLLELSGGLGKL